MAWFGALEGFPTLEDVIQDSFPPGPPGPQGPPGIAPEEIAALNALIVTLQAENASQQGLIDALQARIDAISELPTIRNLLDKAASLEAENNALKARMQELEQMPDP